VVHQWSGWTELRNEFYRNLWTEAGPDRADTEQRMGEKMQYLAVMGIERNVGGELIFRLNKSGIVANETSPRCPKQTPPNQAT
jgi:hypothetical protein